jgi:hypothetical protein
MPAQALSLREWVGRCGWGRPQSGHPFSVAPLGTRLTRYQISRMFRSVRAIVAKSPQSTSENDTVPQSLFSDYHGAMDAPRASDEAPCWQGWDCDASFGHYYGATDRTGLGRAV